MDFYILSQARSGSSLLAEMLNSHSKIECSGELLNPKNVQKKWGKLGSMIINNWPILQILADKKKKKKEHYGFKHIINHAKNPIKFVNTLDEMGFIVLDLRRNNIIEQSFSASIANITGKWYIDQEQKRLSEQLEIDPELLFFRLAHAESQTELQNKLVQGKQFIRINYEEELIDAEKQLKFSKRICNEFGVAFEPLVGNCIKTDERPLSERISNYEDLIKRIENSRFAQYLPKH